VPRVAGEVPGPFEHRGSDRELHRSAARLRKDQGTASRISGMKATCTDEKGRKLRTGADGSITVRSLPAEVRWEIQIDKVK